MGLLNNIKELFVGFIEGLNTAWWVEVTTLSLAASTILGLSKPI
jgi:hypothetical protein